MGANEWLMLILGPPPPALSARAHASHVPINLPCSAYEELRSISCRGSIRFLLHRLSRTRGERCPMMLWDRHVPRARRWAASLANATHARRFLMRRMSILTQPPSPPTGGCCDVPAGTYPGYRPGPAPRVLAAPRCCAWANACVSRTYPVRIPGAAYPGTRPTLLLTLWP